MKQNRVCTGIICTINLIDKTDNQWSSGDLPFDPLKKFKSNLPYFFLDVFVLFFPILVFIAYHRFPEINMDEYVSDKQAISAVFYPTTNVFRGVSSVQLVITGYR